MVIFFPLLFVALVFGLTYLTNIFPLKYLDLQMFIPGGVAVLCLVIGRERISSLFKLGRFKDYVWALFISLLGILIVMGMAWIFSFNRFGWPPEALRYSEGSELEVFRKMFLYAWPKALLIGFLLAMGEEMGWRGYLLEKFQAFKVGFWFRALGVGLIWGAWHIPSYLKMGASELKISLFMMNVLLISVVLTWLYELSRSIWPCVIVHTLHNFGINYFIPQYTLAKTGPYWLHGEEGVLVTIAYSMIVLVLISRRKF